MIIFSLLNSTCNTGIKKSISVLKPYRSHQWVIRERFDVAKLDLFLKVRHYSQIMNWICFSLLDFSVCIPSIPPLNPICLLHYSWHLVLFNWCWHWCQAYLLDLLTPKIALLPTILTALPYINVPCCLSDKYLYTVFHVLVLPVCSYSRGNTPHIILLGFSNLSVHTLYKSFWWVRTVYFQYNIVFTKDIWYRTIHPDRVLFLYCSIQYLLV